MRLVRRLFGGLKDDWNQTGLQSADELRELAASNSIVAAELKEFETKLSIGEELTVAAAGSARALSGYGISVSKQAFLQYANENQ